MTQVLSTTNTLYTLGSATTTWGRTWSYAPTNEFSNANFRLRLTWNKVDCAASRTVSVATLETPVYYTKITNVTVTDTTSNDLRTPGSPCSTLTSGAPADCFLPDGTVFGNPNGFWGTMNTEGAANLNGDAYQPFYDTPTSRAAPVCTGSSTSACYDAENYYNYAVQMPAGSSNGIVYIFDPVFCATNAGSGTGDRWFSGTTAVSSWYEVWDTMDTPYDITDDTLVATSGTKFTGVSHPTPRWAGPVAASASGRIPRTATGATTTTRGTGSTVPPRSPVAPSARPTGSTPPGLTARRGRSAQHQRRAELRALRHGERRLADGVRPWRDADVHAAVRWWLHQRHLHLSSGGDLDVFRVLPRQGPGLPRRPDARDPALGPR